MKNRHERLLLMDAKSVFQLLENMGTENDRIWPSQQIPFRRTRGEMKIGFTKESHGIIKAVLSEYKKNDRIVWSADLPSLKGTHGFYLEAIGENETKITHFLSAMLSWWFWPLWYLKIEKIHNRIIEGIFDKISYYSRVVKTTRLLARGNKIQKHG